MSAGCKIRPNKKLGQVFLRDENILRRIACAAGIARDEVVLEIGAGAGNLTKHLCERAKFVYAVEKDARLCKIAEESLKGFTNVKIICDDILRLEVNGERLAQTAHQKPLTAHRKPLTENQVKVIGNLPYYITTPIIFKLLHNRQYLSDIFVMTQKELAQRIAASPGGKDWGVLSCAAQFYARPTMLFSISKHAFYPQPKVESALIRLALLSAPSVSVKDEEGFLRLIKAAFSRRRKILLNSLSAPNALGIDKESAAAALEAAGIDKKRRAETLCLEEFARLSNFLL